MKNKKLLYIAPTRIDMQQLDGVAKKILGHVNVFDMEYDVDLLYRDNQNVVLYKVSSQQFVKLKLGKNKVDILQCAFSVINDAKYDYCYIRYPNSDLQFISLLKKMDKKGINIVVEIPTYPYDAEGMESVKGKIIHVVDKIFRKQLKKYVRRIITYSDDEKIFGIKTIKTVNGLDFEKVRISNNIEQKDIIHLCGVATFYTIHGYDRLICGMHNYYKMGGKRNIVFDVVGDGDKSILQEYEKMVQSANLSNRVVFHGRLNGTDLDDVYDRASIGVNSLAIHRQNLKNESTLKTREYAAKGLPILSSSYVDAFGIDDNARFVCLVPPNDSPIDINNVIEFYDNLVEGKKLADIKSEIRSKASEICNMPVTLKPIIAYFNSEKNDNFKRNDV